MDTMEDRTEFLNYINSRPLDVHRWSEYSEVNEFVNEIYNELISIKGHETTSKKLVKVIILDLYVAWCADTDLMLNQDTTNYILGKQLLKLLKA